MNAELRNARLRIALQALVAAPSADPGLFTSHNWQDAMQKVMKMLNDPEAKAAEQQATAPQQLSKA